MQNLLEKKGDRGSVFGEGEKEIILSEKKEKSDSESGLCLMAKK